MKSPSLSTLRIIGIAAFLGTVAGIVLSFHRQAAEEKEIEAIETAPDRLSPARFPLEAPGRQLQTGTVSMTAVEGLPQYPSAFVRPLLISAKDGGAEMNIAWFSTRDSADDVLLFYSREFHAKHKTAVTYKFGPNSGYAAYLDAADRRLHMISVMGQPHETVVFASSSYPEKLLDANHQPPSGLPTVEGADSTLSFDLGETGGVGPGRHLWMTTFKQRTLKDVRDAYKKSLTAAGWAVDELPSTAPSETHLEARRSGGSLDVTIRRDAASNVAVYVSMSGA